MFGHSSVNCNMPTKCLVCSGPHRFSECPKKQTRAELEAKENRREQIDRSYVRCANCGENHISTYSQCEARVAFIESQQKSKGGRRPTPPALSTNNFPPPSWAPRGGNPDPQNPSWANVSSGNNTSTSLHLEQQMRMMERMMTAMDNLMQKVSNMLDIVTRHILNSTTTAR